MEEELEMKERPSIRSVATPYDAAPAKIKEPKKTMAIRCRSSASLLRVVGKKSISSVHAFRYPKLISFPFKFEA